VLIPFNPTVFLDYLTPNKFAQGDAEAVASKPGEAAPESVVIKQGADVSRRHPTLRVFLVIDTVMLDCTREHFRAEPSW